MIGNDRLYLAVRTLAAAEGNVRARVCIAMLDVEKLNQNEFNNKPILWKRIESLKSETSEKGSMVVNGRQIKNRYENTALMRRNKTYRRYAEEIMSIWLETCE
jgi:hypothetical protein